jgi:aldose 1-epimerase
VVEPSGRQVVLAAHDQQMVATEVGAGLRAYRAGDDEILDGYGPQEMCSGGRGQILVPWPNRLGGGRFSFDGRAFQAPLNEVDKGNAIHGLVRWANWAVPDHTIQPWTPQTPPDTVQLTFRLHPQPGWGWPLDLRVTYRLAAGSGLEVRTSATNIGDRPCPIGLGWHPYLRTAVDATRLTVPARTVYTSDERGLPTGRLTVEGTEVDFTAGRIIGTDRLDHCYTDLPRDDRGRASVMVDRDDGRRIRVWGDAHVSHFMVFTGDTLAPQRRRRGLAVEPMTCAPDMLNSGDGLTVLEPGRTFDVTWGIDPYS